MIDSNVRMSCLLSPGSIAMAGLGGAELRAAGAAGAGVPRARGPVSAVAVRLAATMGSALNRGPHEWLVLTPKDRLPVPKHVFFPKPPKAPGNLFL